MRAYLVDDEPLALRRLAKLLAADGRLAIAGEAGDPEVALAWLAANEVDVLFLDVQMPGMNGFELLARLERQPLVVFVTAHDDYAVRAFEVSSIDYLLKPVTAARLRQALDKLEGSGLRPTAALERIAQAFPTRIASRLGDRVQLVDLDEVSHFYAEGKLTWAVVGAKTHVIDDSIVELERRLDPRRFYRIHRSTLVQLAHVVELRGAGASTSVVVRGGAELDVARDRVKGLKDRLGI